MVARTEVEKRIVRAWVKKGEARVAAIIPETRKGREIETWVIVIEGA